MSILDEIVGLFAPHDCLVCQREGAILCDWCIWDACPSVSSRCYRCKNVSIDFAVCNVCQKQSKLSRVWVRTDYAYHARELVHIMKFGRAQSACKTIAKLINDTLPFLDDYIITYIPTATTRARQRGYDHARLMAAALARARTLPCYGLLARLGQSRQVGAKKAYRTKQLKDSFWVTRPDMVKGKKILLIDDVVTTGATLEEAARMLKRAGAESVSAAVFAQKL